VCCIRQAGSPIVDLYLLFRIHSVADFPPPPRYLLNVAILSVSCGGLRGTSSFCSASVPVAARTSRIIHSHIPPVVELILGPRGQAPCLGLRPALVCEPASEAKAGFVLHGRRTGPCHGCQSPRKLGAELVLLHSPSPSFLSFLLLSSPPSPFFSFSFPFPLPLRFWGVTSSTPGRRGSAGNWV